MEKNEPIIFLHGTAYYGKNSLKELKEVERWILNEMVEWHKALVKVRKQITQLKKKNEKTPKVKN
jgi:hypothetical protein